MFTGIIRNIGHVRAIEKRGDTRIEIETGLDLSQTQIGASIACSGCCLTVVDKGDNWFAVEVSKETLSKTTIGSWQRGTPVNLEPSLKVGDELGGHIVSGHVDGLAVIKSIAPVGESHQVIMQVPAMLERYFVPKGSVTLDGVSLTVNAVENDLISVNIIPHTWKHTTFAQKREGDAMHLEIDMLARYVEKMLSARLGQAA